VRVGGALLVLAAICFFLAAWFERHESGWLQLIAGICFLITAATVFARSRKLLAHCCPLISSRNDKTPGS
jgi:hypothetical protein